jgi:hypothetical protein
LLGREQQERAEAIDRLLTVDFGARGVVRHLYEAAREVAGRPLALAAAETLRAAMAQPGERVVITTGASSQRLGLDPNLGETDGPPGAVALGRALAQGFGAVPVFLTEAHQVESLRAVARAGGLTTTTPEGATRQAQHYGRSSGIVVESFPDDPGKASIAAKEVIQRFNPVAVVSVERAGMNDRGVYHNSAGLNSSPAKARLDYLLQESIDKGIPVVAIGDGGNELGMGLIAEAVRDHTLYGIACRCGCGGGIVPVTRADVLVVATVSNWGAYGVAAVLGMLSGKPGLAHTSSAEERLVRTAADEGYLDTTGYTDYKVDSLPLSVHSAVVRLLESIVTVEMDWQAHLSAPVPADSGP